MEINALAGTERTFQSPLLIMSDCFRIKRSSGRVTEIRRIPTGNADVTRRTAPNTNPGRSILMKFTASRRAAQLDEEAEKERDRERNFKADAKRLQPGSNNRLLPKQSNIHHEVNIHQDVGINPVWKLYPNARKLLLNSKSRGRIRRTLRTSHVTPSPTISGCYSSWS
ncbi:Uncharacterized protein DBV15_00107 [Temnothorax longispinosus]|uniref:Uncharacterized protein n=1 Tax=Temnothorax longispinosus TaxID=300112 RepID=A0A4S2KDH9_9HYME|nr:Uncharacterized protein DBV15_00107 [Temnothorax longispinosus]